MDPGEGPRSSRRSLATLKCVRTIAGSPGVQTPWQPSNPRPRPSRLERLVQQALLDPLATEILSGELPPGSKVVADVTEDGEGELVVTLRPAIASPAGAAGTPR